MALEIMQCRSAFSLLVAALLTCSTAVARAPAGEPAGQATVYDTVIANGRAMDPESGLDAQRNIGISDARIVTISQTTLRGRHTIDARGAVVAPGFIDIHNHSPTPLGLSYQARDGVTTTLELEVGTLPLRSYGALIRNQALINYGASAGSMNARLAVLTDYEQVDVVSPVVKTGSRGLGRERALQQPANPNERRQIRARIASALDEGAIGIGVPLDYMSTAVNAAELVMLFELGAAYEVPLFVHIRRGVAGDPSGLDEVLTLAEQTGTRLLICHLSHSAMQNTELFLRRIRAARSRGVDVWTEVLPFNAGSTSIGAAVFGRNWQEIFGITYSDVQLAATGERFTAESFARTRQNNPSVAVIHHYLDEAWTRALVVAPEVIISSDGLPALSTDVNIPPQGVGSFAKILGRYVREEQQLELMAALSKMTLQPAQLLQQAAPAFRRKGRLQVGMDADIVVFDPAQIRSNTTYEDPHQASSGVTHLLVAGTPVIAHGAIQADTFPGQLVRAAMHEP